MRLMFFVSGFFFLVFLLGVSMYVLALNVYVFLMQMNPDLADDWAGAIKKLKVGQELCIIPDVCPSEAE